MVILYIIAVYYPDGDLIAQLNPSNCNSTYPIMAEERRFTNVTKRSTTFSEIILSTLVLALFVVRSMAGAMLR